MTTLKEARGYVRVSTHFQSEDGASLESQKKRIKDYCAYKHLNLIDIYEDAGISGKDMNRPALQHLINDLSKGEYIIVSDLSRLSRSTYDALGMFEMFKSKEVNFVCLSPDIDFSTPIGEMMFTVLIAVHRLERQNISMHVSNTMKTLSKEGKLRTRPPFGYKFVGKDKDLEPEPDQQKVIDKIKLMYLAGTKVAQIAKKLNEDGDNKCLINNKKTTPDKIPLFYPETVKRILLDHGLISTNKSTTRVALEQRLVSHHKYI
ncbi:MAG: recombinase family protein [Nitrososphaerota archaeon]